MDSFNFFKGYGKVNDNLEDQSPKPKSPNRKPLVAAISLFAVLFLTLTIAATLGALIHSSNSESPKPQSAPSVTNAAAESIRTVCNVTRFPASCFSSISSSFQNPSDPESILKLSIQVALNELSNLSSSLRTLASTSNGPALADCKDQIDDAMEAAPGGKVLTDSKISDIQTWISAASTDQETCVDGLEEMESSVTGEVKKKMLRSKEYISNSLAIVANIRDLLQRFNMPLH
ncbi:pectinesterase 1 [Senna tora]|uniref:pectinesterase n=1 Tax=Senna tora TaxID=362788 RepID=A0A834W6P5_9FABA|nr:pectinesterase 1 [Senna tora]